MAAPRVAAVDRAGDVGSGRCHNHWLSTNFSALYVWWDDYAVCVEAPGASYLSGDCGAI